MQLKPIDRIAGAAIFIAAIAIVYLTFWGSLARDRTGVAIVLAFSVLVGIYFRRVLNRTKED
jgi:hypothetical protein